MSKANLWRESVVALVLEAFRGGERNVSVESDSLDSDHKSLAKMFMRRGEKHDMTISKDRKHGKLWFSKREND